LFFAAKFSFKKRFFIYRNELIDSLSNLIHMKVYIYAGEMDYTVNPELSRALRALLMYYGVAASNITTEFGIKSGNIWEIILFFDFIFFCMIIDCCLQLFLFNFLFFKIK
jgi:hypothetical protein